MAIIKVAGYVKLAKLWERSAEKAIEYQNDYYALKFSDTAQYELIGVFIDITGRKEIYHRPEMLRLLHECEMGHVDVIVAQTRGYLAANTKEFCYLIHFLASLDKNIEIITEDESYNINTAINVDRQKEALQKMAQDYITLNPQDYVDWYSEVKNAIFDLYGE